MAEKSFQLASLPPTPPHPLPPSPTSHPRSLRLIGTLSTQDHPLHLLALPMLLGSQWAWPDLRYAQLSTEQQVRQTAIEDCVRNKKRFEAKERKSKSYQSLHFLLVRLVTTEHLVIYIRGVLNHCVLGV